MNKKNIVLLFCITLIAALVGCQSEEAATPLSASLSELSGLVEMKQADQETFNQASADTVLAVNGQVQTGVDGRVRLDLSSGTIIRVAPTSLFTLTSNEEMEGGLLTKIKLEAGRVFIILNGGQTDVETPSGVASVKGSYLSVQVENGNIVITCLEGTCSLDDPNGGVILIPPGFKITLIQDPNTGEWGTPLLGEMSPEELQEWLDANPEAKELVEQALASLTEAPTEEPTEEPTAPPTEVETVAPDAAASNACSNPEEPIDGSALGKIGQVTFAWTEQPNAQAYIITFVNSDGSSARVETTNNSLDLYIEVLPAGGTYTWFVTAFGSDGAEICSSASVTFTKPQADPTQKVPPTNDPTENQEPAPTEDACQIDFCSSPSCPGYDPYICGGGY